MKRHDSHGRSIDTKATAPNLAMCTNFLTGVAVIYCLAGWFGTLATSYLKSRSETHSAQPRSQPEVAIANQPLTSVTSRGQNSTKLEVEVITVSAEGFFPTAITRRKGLVCFVVANENSYQETALVLDRVGGNRLSQSDISPSQPRWGDWFELLPGEYVLSDQLHRERNCRITVIAP